jgi:hypothetical protein
MSTRWRAAGLVAPLKATAPGGVALAVEPEGDGEAQLEAPAGRPGQLPPVGRDDAPDRLEVAAEAGLGVVVPAALDIRLDVELDALEAFFGGDGGAVVADQLDQQLGQVAELPGPAGPAAGGLHGQAVAGRGGHVPPQVVADDVELALAVGVVARPVGGVDPVAELQVDGPEAVGPQEGEPTPRLGERQGARPVPFVDGHGPGRRGGGGGRGPAGQAPAGDGEHGRQDQDAGCPAHRAPPRRLPRNEYLSAAGPLKLRPGRRAAVRRQPGSAPRPGASGSCP